jgi:hypothetical protein
VTYLDGLEGVDLLQPTWRWDRLVHVCRRWRSVVFASPNFLDLKLVCGPRTRAELTGIWPPLPIIIRNAFDRPLPEYYDFDAATVHHNRVCQIHLVHLGSSQIQRLASAMREQFPALIHLRLDSAYYRRPVQAPALPDEFLGGSAPRLQSLEFSSIAFPALPRLLLSATGLVCLSLWNIPHSGYFSPEVITAGLAVLANLKSLTIEFGSSLPLPDRESRRPPPPTRTVLPALTHFEFGGLSEYLEDLVARIDAPFLDSFWITFVHEIIFDIPQLAQLTRRTPKFQALNEAHVVTGYYGVQVDSLPPTQNFDKKSGLGISCEEYDWQLSNLAQFFTSLFPSVYVVEHLYIYRPRNVSSQWQNDMENMQWLEILHPFTAVKKFYVCKEFAQCIAPALQELVGERVTNVLPALENLFLEELEPSGPVQEALGHFIAARQLLGRPVGVSHWNGITELKTSLRRF